MHNRRHHAKWKAAFSCFCPSVLYLSKYLMSEKTWWCWKVVMLPSKSEQENDRNNQRCMLWTSGRERRQLARSTSVWPQSQLEPHNHNQSTVSKCWFILYLFIFYHFTVFSSHTVNGQQMYCGGLVVGKASTIGIEISPAFPWFSHGSKNAKCGIVYNITQIWVARVWKCSNITRVVRSLRQKNENSTHHFCEFCANSVHFFKPTFPL